jgi:hypothetical protein
MAQLNKQQQHRIMTNGAAEQITTASQQDKWRS